MSFYTEVDRVFATWNYNHPRILHALLRSLKSTSHVECGVYRGLSTAWAAKAMQENNVGRVYGIDSWSLTEHAHILNGKTPKQHAEENLTTLGVREWVTLLDGKSDEVVWPEIVTSAYLDSWHSHEVVAKEFALAEARGAYLIALDDTENCVGPRLFVEENRKKYEKKGWDVADIHSDNGLTIFLKRQPRRLITFSQELPLPNPGVDLRPLSLEEQRAHFEEAEKATGLHYSSLYDQTQHDMPV